MLHGFPSWVRADKTDHQDGRRRRRHNVVDDCTKNASPSSGDYHLSSRPEHTSRWVPQSTTATYYQAHEQHGTVVVVVEVLVGSAYSILLERG